MIAGLPWTAWLLLLCAVAPGFSLALLFVAAHARDGVAATPSQAADEDAEEPAR